jgi:RNA polymerase sigma-54 factor
MNNLEFKELLLQKHNLKLFMKQWLPILQGGAEDLESYLVDLERENPYFTVKTNLQKNLFESKKFSKNSTSDKIEALTLEKSSLYEKLFEQIAYPLFPTPISQDIAKEIILNINEEGYFEGDIGKIAVKFITTKDEVEKIRNRFSYLEPIGVGAKTFKESMQFQLNDLLNETNISTELLTLLHTMIDDFENLDKYANLELFKDAKSIIKKFKNPPAIEYVQVSRQIIPEVYVSLDHDEITIKINNSLYPDIIVKVDESDEEFVKEKIKEAKSIEKLLELRKQTIYKITLAIIEKQIRFFYGGELQPLKMSDIAEELEFNESTISRAISNKYLECAKGVFPIKYFFSNEISNNISSSEIKSFVLNLIKYEDKEKPLTDIDIAKLIEQRYHINFIRRSITKYRQELNIASSIDRKRLYLIEKG